MGTMNKNGTNEINQLLVDLWARKLMDEAGRKSVFMSPRLSLTRWQKTRLRFALYGDRIRNAWDALRGIDNSY